MSLVEDKQDIRATKVPVKCRIPQMQKHKTLTCKSKISPTVRPKSANKGKNDTTRHLEREKTMVQRPTVTFQKASNRSGRPVITVPIDSQAQRGKSIVYLGSATRVQRHVNFNSDLPTQEHITNLELESKKDSNSSDTGSLIRGKDISLLNVTWETKAKQFERMKKDLAERQQEVVQFYASMENTHQQMKLLGRTVELPSKADLNLMNTAMLSPEQLLRVCTTALNQEQLNQSLSDFDAKRLYGIPTKLMATCDQTLIKHKEIIEWFSTITTTEKKIAKSAIEKKIQEFNGENEMLRCSFEQAKLSFFQELNDVVDFIRYAVQEAAKLQFRIEEQSNEISELNSHNNSLWKEIHNNEYNKKFQECQADLNAERANNSALQKKVTMLEEERATDEKRTKQLQESLEESRAKCLALETTVEQLKKQNQKIQEDFDVELNNLTDSIRKNTVHLEEIGNAREKLQIEKEDLEKRLEQLTQNYNESMEKSKTELNANVKKIVEVEIKYKEKLEEAINVAAKLNSVSIEKNELEKVIKDLQNKCSQYEAKVAEGEEETKMTKKQIELAMNDLNDYKRRIDALNNNIKIIESNREKILLDEKVLKDTIKCQEGVIEEMRQREEQKTKLLQESEEKMNLYEQQIASLKTQVAQLKEDFGDFENLDELRLSVSNQRAQLMDLKKQNEDITRALQEKDRQLQHQINNVTKFDNLLKKKDEDIKTITKKQEEQESIIKLLRNNLEMRSHADEDLIQDIAEKKTEIMTLVNGVETRDQQLSQLEKIILVLEEESRKADVQRKKDREKINFLEKRLAEYETSVTTDCRRDGPVSSLDDIINILEEELSSSVDPTSASRPLGYYDHNRQTLRQSDHEALPSKIILGNNLVKKNLPNNEQFKYLGRKEAITNISHNQERTLNDSTYTKYSTVTDKEQYKNNQPDLHSNEVANLMNNKYQTYYTAFNKDEKKRKMFKFAGHRL